MINLSILKAENLYQSLTSWIKEVLFSFSFIWTKRVPTELWQLWHCSWLMKAQEKPRGGLPCAWRWLQLSAGTRPSPCGCSHRPPSVASADLHHTCPSLHRPEETNIRQLLSNSRRAWQSTSAWSVKGSYLHEHVADVFVPPLSCSVERGAFVLRFHLKVWVDAVHWKGNGEGNYLIKKTFGSLWRSTRQKSEQ